MRPKDLTLAQELDDGLRTYDKQVRSLPGIRASVNRQVFLEQLVESIRRVKYVLVISTRDISDLRADPSSDLFDPLKAALLRQRQGEIDEAFWFVFLFVHFGKHGYDGWRLARDIYGSLEGPDPWNWARISSNPQEFRRWLAAHEAILKGDGINRRFGNHRKYESLKDSSPRGTASVVESYVQWVGPPGTHLMLIQDAHKKVGQHPRTVFDHLYHSMDTVISFGRLAKFDYLTMVGKLGLAPIEPGSTYLEGATGPLPGARLLFGGSTTSALKRKDLDTWLVPLEADLGVGMQALEDALCNWQKSPGKFIPFRG